MQVLRMGLFELTERRLAHHALSQHVDLAKAAVGLRVGNFVNGVLRTAARCVDNDTLPTPEVDTGRMHAWDLHEAAAGMRQAAFGR